ncbi:MAG TPA: Trp biosynthesis-associated membrane protein, partial [Propionibacteriaceae bacterium]|nr:Trp biosynthesis-associated membrane protein [Propionibacteriaceae bacterium]
MRSRALAFGCLLLGGGLALVGSAQPWWRAVGEGVAVKFSGTQATGGLSQALAIVALAGTLLMLALRTRGRRVIGALLLLVGAGIAVVGGLRLQPSADAVRSQVREVSLADAFQVSATAWPWVFALSGVLVVAGAVLTMTTAGTWPIGS